MNDTLNIGDIIRYYKNNYYGIIVGVKEESNLNVFLYYVHWFDAINKPVSYRATQLIKVTQ
jgi:hypothetical protein